VKPGKRKSKNMTKYEYESFAERLAPIFHQKLCDLPDFQVDDSGSDLAAAVRMSGYSESPRKVINDLGHWRSTVGEFLVVIATRPTA
jgi:hypothetical protein